MRDYSPLRPSRWFTLGLVLTCAACARGDPAAAREADGASAGGAQAAFPCAHFDELRHFLPESLEGLKRARDSASTGRYGDVSVSEAERSYSRGEEREVKVRIVDTSMGEKLGKAIVAAAEEGRSRAQNDPTAPIFWKDKQAVGFVRYDAASAVAEASLLVGNRYVVAVSSRGFPGTVEVRRVARGIDLKGLAQLGPSPRDADARGKEQPW